MDIGDTIGSYQLTGKLGSGGMATVYKGYHQRLQREVAVKVMHAPLMNDPDFMSRFEREAQIIGKLYHAHIVPLFDFNQHNGQPYLIMRYIEGQTLKDRMESDPPTLEQIVQIVEAVSSALTYAHQAGVLHRDIKPSNVLIDTHGTPYLTDFGLARLVQTGESSLSAGMVVGTPNYISPEQADGQHEVTERSDVYSFGIMLYELVVGRVPFIAKTPYATLHKQIYDAPPLPSQLNPEVPTEVEMVLLKALEKDPAERYATPADLAEAFKDAVARSGLSQLNPERSRVVPRDMPPTPAINAAPSAFGVGLVPDHNDPAPAKPKRSLPTDDHGDVLLLLSGEDSWANLPQTEIVRRRQKKRRDELTGFIGHLLPYLGVNAMIIINSFQEGSLTPFTLITPLAWGAGLMAHAITFNASRARSVERLYRQFDEHMIDRYGSGWRDTTPPEEIQTEWEMFRHYQQDKVGFHAHASVYLMINMMLWMIWAGSGYEDGSFSFPWPLFVTGGWITGLIGHWFQVNGQSGSAQQMAAVDDELAMMRSLGSSSAKPKRTYDDVSDTATDRDRAVRLTADGELTESTVQEWDDDQPRHQRR